MDKVKQWKPGQLVTLEGKTYRIKRNIGNIDNVCNNCAFLQRMCMSFPCNKCMGENLIDKNLHFERVYKASDFMKQL